MSSPSIKGSTKIASYDYDWTIGTPRGGKKFANGRADWEWWDESVPTKLKALYDDGYKIVFFTNQAGIEKNKTTIDVVSGKFIDIAKELGFPIQVFVAAATNHFRKPFTTMWDHMIEFLNEGVKPELDKCFYVGDAAGREKNWKAGAKKDFSTSDRKFASNVKIDFLTPEEHFLGHKPTDKWKWGSIDPSQLDEHKYSSVEAFPADAVKSGQTEVVLLVGQPASGKSTFAKRHFVSQGFQWVNRDTLKTPARCLKATKEALERGSSVVIDNTNPDAASRDPYIQAALGAGVPIRCFWFQTPREIAEHLNMCRAKQTNGEVRRIPAVAYNVFNKKFSAPQKKEGFTEVIKVNFKPSYDNEDDRILFTQWT